MSKIGAWFFKLIRQFFFSIDQIVFNFISNLYDLLISIARTSPLSQSDIIEMADKIYKLLAVFMIFKVTLSLITYLVNPDDFSDKSKGISKLGTNIIISLSLLILTPYIFNYAYELQTIILEDNSLATLLFETEKENGTNSSFLNGAGDKIAYITMSGFLYPNVSINEISECANLYDSSGNIDGECKNQLLALAEKDKNVFDSTMVNNYTTGVEYQSLGLTFRADLISATYDDTNGAGLTFVMEYNYIFSTVVGVVICLILITYCMDIAVRSIKLAFLQLIAPIPILSYVDPKSGKDGMFKKWYQMCFKTYLSLFIRLLALYFAVYIIQKVADRQLIDIIDGSTVTNIFVKIFIIIGALMFAKQLPKMLEGLGIKLDGDGKFFLNPLKKFSEQALGGKQILGMGAAGLAGGAAGVVNFGSRLFNADTWKNKNGKVTAGSFFKGLGKTVGSTVAGTTSALGRGTLKAAKGEKAGKIFANSYGEAMFAKLQREDLSRKGSTFGGRLMSDLARHTGNLNAAQRQTLDLAELDSEYKTKTDTLKAQKEAMELSKAKKIEKSAAKRTHLSKINDRITTLKGVTDSNGNSINVKDQQELVDNLKANGSFYVKVGEKYTVKYKDENGEWRTSTKKATAQDVANMVKSDVGAAADDKLTEQKNLALKYLVANDEEVKTRSQYLKDLGVDVTADDMTASKLKTEMVNEQNAEAAINAEYYKAEEEFKLKEKELADEYKQKIEEYGLDKESEQWIANEADNAARWVKNPQQEGWKPSGTVNSSSYVRNPRLGNYNGPGGGHVHRPHDGSND